MCSGREEEEGDEATGRQSNASSPVTGQRSPWHSPVPYLFGGLAAMMGLIVFALLILACSYWKLYRNLRNRPGDLEAGAGDGDFKSDNSNIPTTVLQEMCVVIMAGDEKPTFLAKLSSGRTSSFGNRSCRTSDEESSASAMEKDESSDQVQVSTMENHVSADL
ncbi:hypothetical protein E3N88_41160 [Mikania micrantha]|uniref:Protein GLUTAMINE DUMPER 3 n=1 Tax=Mikania micrantha TaxID=192012 RepID=A0A5N6LPL5_9ASTR|nr:hypothetical protein E3N88_41160 [Mikania micrantha]